jgi:Tfp pilus assembly protein PilN
MSVAINLLPDVRLARIRAQHIRHLVTGIAVAIWIVVAIIVGALFGGIGAQTLVLNNVNNQIQTDISSINGTNGLSDALTTQQRLVNLPGLYNSRTYYSKFMPILAAAMPPNVTVTNISTTPANSLTITGTGSSALAVDTLYESLKVAGQGTTGGNYFSAVSITSVSKDATTGLAAFTLSATLAPSLFAQGATNG